MSEIPAAKMSPRISSGALIYYEGDTFSVPVSITLRDISGSIITDRFAAGTEISVTFYDKSGQTVTTVDFSYDAGDIEVKDGSGTITLCWDSAMTQLFSKGRYSYKIRLNGEFLTTVAKGNVVIVQ